MKQLFFLTAITFLILLYSCGDCNLVEADFPCRVREATIAEFNPRLTEAGENNIVPVARYSVATFQFPQDNSSSGTLTNDTRFDSKDISNQFIAIAEEEFESGGRKLKAQLISFYPSNTQMAGDIMLIGSDSLFAINKAQLRFYGKVAAFPSNFNSENAYTFCQEYLPNYRIIDEDFDIIAAAATDYGSLLSNSVTYAYSKNDIRVLDEEGKDVTAAYINNIPQDALDNLLSSESNQVTDLIVMPGEVYYYKARNGKEFALVITEARQGTFEPYLNRVTFRFSEIRGAKTEECPD